MKDELTIYMDFKMTSAQSAELAAIAEGLKAIKNNDFWDAISLTEMYWSGENARAFIDKMKLAFLRLEGNISKVDAAAQTVSDIAEQTKDAELAALQLARQG